MLPADEVATAAAETVAELDAPAPDPAPPTMMAVANVALADVVPETIAAVPFCAMARAAKADWDLLAVGLMEKTIPFPQ